MDKQCREYILMTKRKLFGIASQRTDRAPSDAVLNVRHLLRLKFLLIIEKKTDTLLTFSDSTGNEFKH